MHDGAKFAKYRRTVIALFLDDLDVWFEQLLREGVTFGVPSKTVVRRGTELGGDRLTDEFTYLDVLPRERLTCIGYTSKLTQPPTGKSKLKSVLEMALSEFRFKVSKNHLHVTWSSNLTSVIESIQKCSSPTRLDPGQIYRRIVPATPLKNSFPIPDLYVPGIVGFNHELIPFVLQGVVEARHHTGSPKRLEDGS